MVRSVINSGAAHLLRPNKAEPYRAQILELYSRCDGNLMRVYEELMAQGAPFSYQTLTRFVRRNPFGNAKSSVTRSITTAQQWLTKIVPGARSLRNPQHRVATKGILFLLASCHAALRLGPTVRTRASSWVAQGNLTKFSVFWRHAIVELGMGAATSPFCRAGPSWHESGRSRRASARRYRLACWRDRCARQRKVYRASAGAEQLRDQCAALRPIAERRGFLFSIVPARGLRDCVRQSGEG
jgi:hypothetical protein